MSVRYRKQAFTGKMILYVLSPGAKKWKAATEEDEYHFEGKPYEHKADDSFLTGRYRHRRQAMTGRYVLQVEYWSKKYLANYSTEYDYVRRWADADFHDHWNLTEGYFRLDPPEGYRYYFFRPDSTWKSETKTLEDNE